MKNLFFVVKNELLRYFISPVAYIYLVSFLVLNAVCTFYFGHWFERGEASLFYMFVYQPWLYLLFLPGIAMRLWAEEFKSKTIVQIMTMPISLPTLVWGKFLAAWIFAGLALFLTFPFVITVNFLGTPDNNVIILSYFSSFVLAGAMLSISGAMSALTKNQVIALVTAVVANLIFFFSGMEFVLSFFRLFCPDYIIDTIASFSFLTHYSTMISGTIEWKDVLFFASVIILFNFTTMLIVSFKTAGSSSWFKSNSQAYYIAAFIVMLLGLTGFNLLANNLTQGTELDVTEEKFYTLNKDTVNVLQDIEEPVTAKLYFSDILAKQNPNFRELFDRVKMLLTHYKNASNGKFDYRIYHPKNLDTIEDRALSEGLRPIALIDLNQNALFGLSIVDELNRKEAIPYLSVDRIMNLEQDLTTLIYRMGINKKTIGIITGLPILGTSDNNFIIPEWEIVSKISELYELKVIQTPEDLNKMDALMMVYPKNLTGEMVEAVKNYSRNYGKILVLLDTATEASRLYQPTNAPYQPSDLNGLDSFWGFKFYNEYVVADLENSITVDATTNYKTNPVYTQDIIQFKLKEDNLNPLHPVTQNLHTLFMTSASVIMPLEDAEVSFMPLIQPSLNSALMPNAVVYNNLNPRQILSRFKKDDNIKVISAYIHGTNPNNQFDLIVVGDTDFMYDTFWGKQQVFAETKYFTPLFNNADFVLNALDFLTNNYALLGLRGKGSENRAFKDVEKLRKESIFAYKIKEEEIFEAMDRTRKDLQEIETKRNFEDRETFNADELAVISNIRKKLDDLKNELSELKLTSLSASQHIALKIKLINILLIPLILSLILALTALLKKHKRSIKPAFEMNIQFFKLASIALALLALGLFSVYLTNRSEIELYEGKLVLPHLKDKINDVTKIKLQNQNTVLTFVKQDSLWVLEEHPDALVYQERIKNLLSTLISATFYEKKSDKAENLSKFNLSPFESGKSSKTRIELKNKDDYLIEGIDIGDYDLEIGRGEVGAYVKFDNKFQVWLVCADFIDLSLDYHQWTYSHIWNLRFGRLASVNGQTNTNFLLSVMKFFLNAEFVSSTTDLQNPKEKQKIDLLLENDVKLSLVVYEAGDKYYVKYDFPPEMTDKYLAFFKTFAIGRYFEITPQNWEIIRALGQTKK